MSQVLPTNLKDNVINKEKIEKEKIISGYYRVKEELPFLKEFVIECQAHLNEINKIYNKFAQRQKIQQTHKELLNSLKASRMFIFDLVQDIKADIMNAKNALKHLEENEEVIKEELAKAEVK